MRGVVLAPETNECFAFVGLGVVSNGQVTDEADTGVLQFASCIQEQWFGGLPFEYHLRLGSDGSATAEAPLGVHRGDGCVYEGTGMGGGFELNAPLNVGLSGTLTLVAEEVPGAECPGTETVSVQLAADRGFPYAELIG